ncbi:MAG TPA: hypothetical protein VMJ32_12830 [Pirellulales bacterium]|nr:hypothetical protein [Pirellulales bacterium]
MSVSDDLRTIANKALQRGDYTVYSLAKASEVEQSVLHRWIAGTDLAVKTLHKVAKPLGYDVILRKQS